MLTIRTDFGGFASIYNVYTNLFAIQYRTIYSRCALQYMVVCVQTNGTVPHGKTTNKRIFDIDLESIYGIYVHEYHVFSIKKILKTA